MSVHIHLFNGVRSPGREDRHDGPVIGPFEGVQVVHGVEVLGIVGGEAVWEAGIVDGAVLFRGTAYTDFVVSDRQDARRLGSLGAECVHQGSLRPGDGRVE